MFRLIFFLSTSGAKSEELNLRVCTGSRQRGTGGVVAPASLPAVAWASRPRCREPERPPEPAGASPRDGVTAFSQQYTSPGDKASNLPVYDPYPEGLMRQISMRQISRG